MGLFTKIKNILFEEDEIPEEEQKKETKGVIKEEKPSIKKEEPISHQVRPEKGENCEIKESNYDTISERELFKSDNSFPFPEFDEEEFNNSIARQKPKSRNVMDYERKRRVERKTDYGRYEKTEIKETIERKKFKPSPIISPVYGILNEDYKIEDIKDGTNIENLLDIDEVRKKAFDSKEIEENKKPKTRYYEEEVTVKLKEPEEEKRRISKDIDELLEDTSDVIIDDKNPTNGKQTEYDKIEEELDEVSSTIPKNENNKIDENDDTLENDLFDLIDSMYDDGEDGDK